MIERDLREELKRENQEKIEVRKKKERLIVYSSFLVEKHIQPDGEVVYRTVDNHREAKAPVGIILYGMLNRGIVVDMSNTHAVEIYEVKVQSWLPSGEKIFGDRKAAHLLQRGNGREMLYKKMLMWDNENWKPVQLWFSMTELLALSYLAYRLRNRKLYYTEETLILKLRISKWRDNPNLVLVTTNKNGVSSAVLSHVDFKVRDLHNLFIGERKSARVIERVGILDKR